MTAASIRRLHEKIALAGEEIIHYDEFFLDDADYAVVTFGGVSRTAYEAVQAARQQGLKVGLLRLMTVWPFADKAIAALAKKVKGILVPELNYGQLVGEIERAAAGQCPVQLLAKYNMEIFTSAEIEAAIKNLCEGGRA